MGVKTGKTLDGDRALATATASEQKEITNKLLRQLSFAGQVQRRGEAGKSERFILRSEPVESGPNARKFKVEIVRSRGFRDLVAQVIVEDGTGVSEVEIRKALELSAQSSLPQLVD